jgi:peptidoglycan/LPS O-acetylase OafA/YrhL
MTDTLQDKRIPILQILRAVAALSVCFYHFICTVTGFINTEFLLKTFNYGKYGVQLFFVISGLVIPWSMYHSNYKLSSFPKFIAKRLIRLEPPYIATICIAIVYTYVRTLSPYYNDVDITPNTKQILLHFGYLIPFFKDQVWINNVFWTLAVEFQYYLFIAFAFVLLNHQRMMWRMVAYAIMFGCTFIGSREFFPYWIPVFMYGILLFLYRVNRIKSLEFWIMIVLNSLLTLFYINAVTLIVGVSSTLLILFAWNYSNLIFDKLGELTYSIYLIHTIIGAALINFLSHIVTSPVQKFLTVMAGLAVTLISAYLLYRFVEKPSKRWSSSIRL